VTKLCVKLHGQIHEKKMPPV